ncbi:mapmodulin-like protein [Penaeus vannamei]|uniref:Mapmodulin-like protein n=1 Tax=Penaeus vannamei TaxID=6689 RepID=A0A3R7PEY2_PENVA|nr:mapmodulin-like protein [Penaeus vannamei]
MGQGWQIHNLRSWVNRCRYLSTGPVPTAAVNKCLGARLYAARHCPSNMQPPSCSRSRGSRCHWVHITELNLDNCKSTSIVGLTEEFENLEVLSLINVGLTSLKGFPALPNLRKLELSDNRISGGLSALTCLPKLSYLNLSGNKIKDLETLEALKDLKSLVNLDLFNCEVSQIENYREKVFSLIPSLVFLDGFDKEDNSEDEEDGK